MRDLGEKFWATPWRGLRVVSVRCLVRRRLASGTGVRWFPPKSKKLNFASGRFADRIGFSSSHPSNTATGVATSVVVVQR